MARKKVTALIKVNTWGDANEILRMIAEKQSHIDHLVAKHNEWEAAHREVLDEKCNPQRMIINQLAQGLEDFCKERRDDFGKKQSRKLTNGTVSFRLSTPKTKLLSKFTWEKVKELVKNSSWKKTHIRTKEEVDKEQFINDWSAKKSDDDKLKFNEELQPLGFKITQDETFGYEVNVAVDASTGSANEK